MSEDEINRIAQAATLAIETFIELADGNEQRASGLLWGVATEWSLSLGVKPTAMLEQLQKIVKARRESPNSGNEPPV